MRSIAGLDRQSIVPDRSGSKDSARKRELTLFGRQRFLMQRQAEPLPDLLQRIGELIDQSVIVLGRGREPQPLGAFGHPRVIYLLAVAVVIFPQDVGDALSI